MHAGLPEQRQSDAWSTSSHDRPRTCRDGDRRRSALRLSSRRSRSDEPPLMDLGAMLRDSPPWLVSAIVHMVVMIIFGLMFVQAEKKTICCSTPATATTSATRSTRISTRLQNEFRSRRHRAHGRQPADRRRSAGDARRHRRRAQCRACPPARCVPTAIGIALTGREPGMKEALLKSVRRHGQDGRRRRARPALAGQRSNSATACGVSPDRMPTARKRDNHEAATAMALLAFQGAGLHARRRSASKTFTPVVRRGWNALLKQMDKRRPLLRRKRTGTHQLYTQAQCTIALCELYAMTGDAEYYDAAQKAVDYCVQIQSPKAAGGTNPGSDSDMSVTGWFVMALQSARMARHRSAQPGVREDRAVSRQRSRGDERVRRRQPLCLSTRRRRHAAAHRRGPVVPAVPRLAARRPAARTRASNTCSPTCPSGTSGTCTTGTTRRKCCTTWKASRGGPGTRRCESCCREHQEKRGRERGSWDPKGDRWGDAGGRLYVTCLSIYTLEVYYRHLPLYRTGLFENVR